MVEDQRVDVVERQLHAYNAHDVDAFVGSYAEEVVVEDGDGNVLMSGRAQLRAQYEQLFTAFPELRVEVPSRICVGAFVVDEELIHAGPADRAVIIYRIGAAGLIDRVRFLS